MVTQQQGSRTVDYCTEYFVDLQHRATDYLDAALAQGDAFSIITRDASGESVKKELTETHSGVVIVRLGDAVLSVACQYDDAPVDGGRFADIRQSVEFRGDDIEVTEEIDARLNFIPLSDAKSAKIAKKLARLIPSLFEAA